ncbi:MAG: VWA domain-containing protein [Bacilli bacterium]|nr:VWA domain-containing protein [Bacilli bacterium]
MKKKKSKRGGGILLLIIIFLILLEINNPKLSIFHVIQSSFSGRKISILSSNDNKDLEKEIKEYAKKNGFSVDFTYMGDLDIVDELNVNSSQYDAVWISNSMWLYMLNDSKITSESKSISVSPVVMGIQKKKAENLGLVGKDVTNLDILNLIKNKEIKYIMSSVTQTNDGASSYLGFLNALAGSPEVLTEEMLDDQTLIDNMKNLFQGVERVSGDQDYLETMFVNGSTYEAVIASESSLININKKLKANNKEELYLIYPIDGVPINDSTLAFIDHYEVPEKKEHYLELQKYLRSKEGQEKLKQLGRRTWYGGISKNEDKNIFNKDWGIHTEEYLTGTKFPSKKVITKAINLYIEELRKPSHTVFCLDYSGSMIGDGNEQLVESMEYILSQEQASVAKLQFSKHDKITVIPFSYEVKDKIETDNGKETEEMIRQIKDLSPVGGTALYDCAISGLDVLNEESDDYTKTIIAMTDGAINIGTFEELERKYNQLNSTVPIYSITFGSAKEKQLKEIADLTNAKVFNGKSGLLQAFKEVRGYN